MAKIKNKYEGLIFTCPFCGQKKSGNERFCFSCNLNFAELEEPSIKEVIKHKKGKSIFDNFEGEIVKTPVVPNDISFGTLKGLVGFFGFFGVHNFYLGRYFWGCLRLLFGTVAFTLLVLYSLDITLGGNMLALLIVVFGICLVWYVVDLYRIMKKKYKYPVLLKTPIDVNAIFDKAKSIEKTPGGKKR